MKKVINVETAPGKFVPTLVDVEEEVVEKKKKPVVAKAVKPTKKVAKKVAKKTSKSKKK